MCVVKIIFPAIYFPLWSHATNTCDRILIDVNDFELKETSFSIILVHRSQGGRSSLLLVYRLCKQINVITEEIDIQNIVKI